MAGSESRKSRRDALRARRLAVGASERIAAAAKIARQLESLDAYRAARRIAGYWAIAGELPLAAVASGARARQQTYYLPIAGADGRLHFAAWKAGDALTVNRYGIPEPDVATDALLSPEQLDLVLVPLLGFDRRGHRLGYGGGYYDRSFAFLHGRGAPAHPLLVGIGYAWQELADVEPATWDVHLDKVVTEESIIDCRPESSA
jgi:5-formyltetrahydrofolate cyclo-ligase